MASGRAAAVDGEQGAAQGIDGHQDLCRCFLCVFMSKKGGQGTGWGNAKCRPSPEERVDWSRKSETS